MEQDRSEIDAFCPHCGYKVDGATGVGEANEHARPSEGAAAICIRCAGLAVYVDQPDGSLGLRLPTAEETAELEADDNVIRAQGLIRMMGTTMSMGSADA